jgi:hypothetical protein
VFASKFFELSAKSGELFLHQISSNLRYIFTQQPILILQTKKLNFSMHKVKSKQQKITTKQTLAAAAVCKPPIPGRLLIFSSSSYDLTTKTEGCVCVGCVFVEIDFQLKILGGVRGFGSVEIQFCFNFQFVGASG